MDGFPLESWFYELPLCTRTWTLLTLLTSLAVQCKFLTPFQLFYSPRAVFHKHQYWRLITTFLYFGPLSLDLIFHVFFLQRYSRLLESSSGRSPASFSWLLLYATCMLLLVSPIISQPFLGSPLSNTLVYIWSRRNPETRLSFLGLVTFTAPYLPWVLMGFSLVVHGTLPRDEMLGIVVGHGESLLRHHSLGIAVEANEMQYGISSTTSTHRYTTARAHSILQCGGGGYGKEGRRRL